MPKKNRGGDNGCIIIDCDSIPQNDFLHPENNISDHNYSIFKSTCKYENGNKENIINKNINKESIAKGVSFLPNGSLLEKYLISINKAKCSDNNINPTNTPSDNNSNKSNNNNNNNSNKSNNNNNTNQPKNICELKHPAIQVIDNMFENDHIISKNQAYNIYRIYETICNTVKQISTCENSSNIKLKVTNNTTLKKEDYNHLYHNLFVKEYLNNTEKNPYYILEKNRKYIDMEVVPKKEGGTRRHRKKLNKKTKKRKTNKRRKTRKIKNV